MQLGKKIRTVQWFLGGLYGRYRSLLVSSFIAGLVLVVFFVKLEPILRDTLIKERKIIGIAGLYTPASLPVSIQQLVSSGLTGVDANGLAVPALAKSWEVNDEGTEYIFYLRDDIVWHDGKKFTAHDVNYNLKDVGFVAIDDYQLRVSLQEPFSPLPNFLSRPLFRKGLVGVGPYKLDTIRLIGEYVSYLKLSPIGQDLPELNIKLYSTEATAKVAYKLGEVTALEELIDPTPFMDWRTVEVSENEKYHQFVALYFNLDYPLFQAKEIRQGLAFMIDKSVKNRVVSPISSQSWAYTTQVKTYEKDAELAKKLLDGKPIDEEIVLSTFPHYLNLANEIAEAWKEAGIKTKIKVETGLPIDYQVLLFSQEIPSDPDQYNLWHSTQSETNITHYSNAKIDKLLEDARKETDVEKRKEFYFDFQRYLVEDAPAIFLFHPSTYTISRK